MYVRMYIHIQICMAVDVYQSVGLYIYIYILHKHAGMNVCINTYSCMYVYMYECISVVALVILFFHEEKAYILLNNHF